MKERRHRLHWWVIIAAVIICIATVVIWLINRPRPLNVQITTVRRQSLQSKVFAAGTVRAVRRQIVMPTQLTGPVGRIEVQVGQTVRSGQILLTTVNTAQHAAVSAALVTVNQAQLSLRQAEVEYQSAPPGVRPQLFASLSSAKSAAAQAQAQLAQAQAALAATRIRAQMDGKVILINRDGIASDGTPLPLVEVVSSQKQVVTNVSQADAVHLRSGLSASITSEAYPNVSWRAKVGYVANYAIANETGTGQVEVDLTPEGNFPVPVGYQVDVHVVSSTRRQVAVIPYDALSQDGDQYVVYTYQNGRVNKVPVTLGITSDTDVEVTKGLRVGAQVVLNPPSTLREGETVHALD